MIPWNRIRAGYTQGPGPAYVDPPRPTLRERLDKAYDEYLARQAAEPPKPDLAGATPQETMSNVWDWQHQEGKFAPTQDFLAAPAADGKIGAGFGQDSLSGGGGN